MSPGGEISNTPFTAVEQDGKSVWLIHQDSTGHNYEDENGIHKIKYSTYQYLRKRKMITEYFNLQLNYLDTGTVLGYGKAKEIWKKDKLIEQSFLDSTDHLIQPYYFNYAKMKQKYYKDGSWRVKYFDSNKNPSCNRGVTEQHIKWDTLSQINEMDTSYLLSIKVLSSKKCAPN
jgi:hypothetical protein